MSEARRKGKRKKHTQASAGRGKRLCKKGRPFDWACPFISNYGTKHMQKRTTTNRVSGRRELINTGRDKRFVRRNASGQFKESDDVGRSLSADRRKKAKTAVKAGQGDRGDRRRR